MKTTGQFLKSKVMTIKSSTIYFAGTESVEEYLPLEVFYTEDQFSPADIKNVHAAINDPNGSFIESIDERSPLFHFRVWHSTKRNIFLILKLVPSPTNQQPYLLLKKIETNI